MSIVQGTLPVGSLDHAITLNVQSSGGNHFETVTDTTPYLHRASPQDVASSMKLKKVVGGTIAWNQQIYDGNFADATSWGVLTGATVSISNNECVATITGNFGGVRTKESVSADHKPLIISGHKYLISAQIKASSQRTNSVGLGLSDNNSHYPIRKQFSVGTSYSDYAFIGTQTDGNPDQSLSCIMVYDTKGSEGVTLYVKNIIAIDLTQMFGSTIADYIYSLEQAHAGDGVAWFKALFPKAYYPYNAGELISVKTSARKTYNADNVEIGSYPLDDNLELRGIPKLDSNNELYYDGDTYASDGTVTRKYGVITFGADITEVTSTWYSHDVSYNTWGFYFNIPSPLSNIKLGTKPISDKFYTISNPYGEDMPWGMAIMTTSAPNGYIAFRIPKSVIETPTNATDLATKINTWMGANPFTVVYELATPTTESADAYTQSQRVGATEEFVDARSVPMPVGNVSEYKRLIQED